MNARCSSKLAQIVVLLGRMERLKERARESMSEGEITCVWRVGGGGAMGKGERGREGGENEDSVLPPGQSKLASAIKYRSLQFIKPSAQYVSF